MGRNNDTLVFITPTEISGSDVVDTKGSEILRGKFTTEHKDAKGVLIFVDLEPASGWPHFCRWVWVDNRGWTKQIDHSWPPGQNLDMVCTSPSAYKE